MELNELIRMSGKYGADPEYVLAGGGNTSYKEKNVMAVKASGTALSTIDKDGFILMDTEKLRMMTDADYPEDDKEREKLALKDMMAARFDLEGEKRPSVECILHALFPQKYVLHVHPALINGLTCGRDGATRAAELFADISGDFLWVPLTKPGYILSKTCAELLDGHVCEFGKYPAIVMLQNHGIFVAADDVVAIDRIMKDVVSRINRRITKKPDMDPGNSVGSCSENMETAMEARDAAEILKKLYSGCAVFLINDDIRSLTVSKESYKPVAKPFTPDHIVYCRAYPLWADSLDELPEAFEKYDLKYGGKPKIAAIKGLGVFAMGKDATEANLAAELYIDTIKIAVYSESFGGPLALTDELIDFIVNWESESYRQKQSI